MEYDSTFEIFLQNIYSKISIAVAISVIKSKPENLSLDDHIENIRKSCLKKWQISTVVTTFENKIISAHQSNVLRQINELIPLTTTAESDDSDFGPDEWFPGITSEIKLPNALEGCESSSDESVIEDNAEFMKAMIKLKYIVNTQDSIVLKPSAINSNLPTYSAKKLRSANNSERDSGFNSVEMNTNSEKRVFSTCLLRYVANSSETNTIITKCLDTMFNYIKQTLAKDSSTSFNYWKDSVLDRLFATLKEVSSDVLCSESISTFVEDMLEYIWISEEINQHQNWECLCILLNELCATPKICGNILTFLFGKMNDSVAIISTIQQTVSQSSDILLIEKIPHFIRMITLLLSKWKRIIKKKRKSDSCNEKETCDIVTNLWKEKWDNEDKNSEELLSIEKWKGILEKLITCTTENYPLISLMVYDIINILDQCSGHSDKLNEK